MSESHEKPPVIPLELRQRLDIHRLQIRICELEYANAELRLQVADKVAALESQRLTRDREELAAAINTAHWRFDFDAYDFVRRGQPAAAPVPVVHVEAVLLQAAVTCTPEAVPAGSAVRVRVRHRRDEAPHVIEACRAQLQERFAQAVRLTIEMTPVADLE